MTKTNKKIRIVRTVQKAKDSNKKEELNGENENDTQLKVRTKKTDSITSKDFPKSISIRKTLAEASKAIKNQNTSESQVSKESEPSYNRDKLARTITDNLIPIEINPLKVILSKEPPIREENEENQIALSVQVESDLKTVWKLWTLPKHIKAWHTVDKKWKVTEVKNDLKVGGSFFCSMKSASGEVSEFSGEYIEIIPQALITYITKENLNVLVSMAETSSGIVEINLNFEPDEINPISLQRRAWDILLKNFNAYVTQHGCKKTTKKKPKKN